MGADARPHYQYRPGSACPSARVRPRLRVRSLRGCLQIKAAMQELERGNGFVYATGKEARKEERQAARDFKWVGGTRRAVV